MFSKVFQKKIFSKMFFYIQKCVFKNAFLKRYMLFKKKKKVFKNTFTTLILSKKKCFLPSIKKNKNISFEKVFLRRWVFLKIENKSFL